jgi:hypothetical protein
MAATYPHPGDQRMGDPMIFDVLVPVKPDEVEWYLAMYRRNNGQLVVATDEDGKEHHGRFVAAEAHPSGVRITLDDPHPLGTMTGGSAWKGHP